jgi:PST family polysaccharide transporter
MTDQTPTTPRRPRHDYFDDTDVSQNMGSRIVHGSAFVFGSSVAKFLISIGATAVLARLLDPEAYGLLAMVFVVTNFLMLFRDLNLSLATVQQDRITHAQVSTLYWINVAITVLISAIVLSLAPAIAWIYDEPRLTGIAMLLTVSILLRGLAAQHQALLRRKMRFGALTATDVGSLVAGYATAIILAYTGYGYWSLVWLHISTSSVFLILSWIATGWRPGLPVRGSGVRSMIAFGTNLTGYSIVRFTSRSLDNALIGWYWGAIPLGIYSKSRDLLGPIHNYLTSPVGSMAIPSLSRLTTDEERYRRTFSRLAEKIALIVLPATVLLIASAYEIIEIVLGPKWMEAAPIVAILAVMVSNDAISGCANWLFISQGRGNQLFRYGVFEAVVRILAIVIGVQWGITGIAVGLASAALFVQLPVHIWYGCRSGPVSQLHFYRTLLPAFFTSITSFAVILALRHSIPIDGPIAGLAASFGVLAIVHILFLLFTKSGRNTLADIRRGLEILLRRSTLKTGKSKA